MIRRNSKGVFVAGPLAVRRGIAKALRTPSDSRFASYSKIAHHFQVPKSTVIRINKRIKARDGKVFASINHPRVALSKRLNVIRMKAIESYVKNCGIVVKGKRIEGVSINFLIDDLKSRGISPGVKKNLGRLLELVIAKFESRGFAVRRRTKSDQPKRGKETGHYVIRSH